MPISLFPISAILRSPSIIRYPVIGAVKRYTRVGVYLRICNIYRYNIYNIGTWSFKKLIL